MAKKFKFITPTLKFCIAGLFIPGFTAITILGLQMGIEFLGISCLNSWTILWILTTVGFLTTPFVFVQLIDKKLKNEANLRTRDITLFNIIEYTFIQCTLAMFFTNGQTLCYVTDGQNGLEFVFTGWLAIPVLIIMSLAFDRIRERRLQKLNISSSSF
ncbi:MAG: hypothetical protein ACNS60_03500 [Candidatus Cyclobacteriaceae bacterium M2_1C_046]